MKKLMPVLLVAGLMLNLVGFASAEKDPKADETLSINDLIPVEVGPVTVGGAIRIQGGYDAWEEADNDGDFGWNILRIDLDLAYSNLIGSAEYRYYPVPNSEDYHFLRKLWMGYKFDENRQIKFGVSQVPFGLLPYASHNFWFNLPYYVGFEDDYDLGVSYSQDNGPWALDLAFYPRDEGDYMDPWTSDSARYSVDVVDNKSVRTEERNTFNGRLAYTIEHSDTCSSELGVSGQYGQIRNPDSDNDGDYYAGSLHLDGNYGRWNLKAEAIRYIYNLENASGQSEDFVWMGAYGSSFRVATKATVLNGGISYTLPVEWGPVSSLNLYNDYSAVIKDKAGEPTSQLNVLGCSFGAGRIYTYVDLITGKNCPWLGPGTADALYTGSNGSDDWATKININVGYYF